MARFSAASSSLRSNSPAGIGAWLGVTTAARYDALPDVPPIGDTVPGYEASGWLGLGAPKNTPAAIIDKLNIQIGAFEADPLAKARYADIGVVPMTAKPPEFGKFIADETEKWAKVVKFADVKME